MNIKTFLLVVSAAFLGWSISHASVTSIPTWNSSGGIYCTANLNEADQTATVNGNQWGGSGAMGLTLLTDTTTDPILTINESINNTSSFAWTQYIINVAMNENFSINSAGVIAPSGWTANITAPSGPDINGNYIGTIDYVGGAPVAVNGLFDFGYVIQFSGLTQYTLTESVTAVPEPGAFALLMAGGLLVSGGLVAKRRQAKLLRVRA
ncbi:MAG TPA: PEP-CTERM sorting domain-containing protein [Verrucomicrobiae bacterium]|nr:PEP-CTERM sorting domain-containing protein [Verrucomicrobiae bacterium]